MSALASDNAKTASRRRLINILDTYFRDTRKARRLLSDGGYETIEPESGPGVSSQEVLYQEAREAVRRARQSTPTTFEPHRAASE